MLSTVREIERVDPRTRRTRRLLQDAFVELMTEKSFQSITVQDITDRATVNRATFYAHFEDKYAILDQTVRDRFEEVLNSELPAGLPDSEENLQALIVAVCRFLDKFLGTCPHHRPVQFEPLIERQVKEQVYEYLLGWLNGYGATARLAAEEKDLAATITSWAIYGAAYHWARGSRKDTPEEFAGHMRHSLCPLLSSAVR